MSFSKVNFWIEGDISTTRVISRLLNDVVGSGNCRTKLIRSLSWATLTSGLNIFCRISDPSFYWLPSYLKSKGISYAYYLDDNFWKITGSSPLARYYQAPSVVNSLDEFIKGAEFVITHTQVMADFITDRFAGVRCEILPVPFDTEFLDNVAGRMSLPVREFPIVGYAGGYKEEEFEFLEEVICRLNSERPEIRFEFIGGISDGLRCLNNVQWFPGTSDYEAFLSLKVSRGWTVGLAPLMETEFNSSKTNNKFREYSGCHIPGVYSRTSPYVECVRPDELGVLVCNEVGAWVEAIKRIVDDELLQEKIRKESFAFVVSNYSHRVIAPAWKKTIYRIPGLPISRRLESFRFRIFKYCALLGLVDGKIPQKQSSFIWMCKAIGRRASKALLSRLGVKRLFLIACLLSLYLFTIFVFKVF